VPNVKNMRESERELTTSSKSKSWRYSRESHQGARSRRRDVRDSVSLRIQTQVAEVLKGKCTANLSEDSSDGPNS